MGLPVKSFDLFFGTGGVGKTTLATARAVDLANQGKKVLLMTIDPAKRLKDLLGLDDSAAGNVKVITELPELGTLKVPLHALLMDPSQTIRRMGEAVGVRELANNRIVAILAKPHGGMNEILSLIELQMRLDEESYDCIVLDTPPGPHFLDFLDGLEKIRKFFDQRFVEIFTSLGRKAADGGKNSGVVKNIFDKVVNAGVNKLLSYLQRVTGEHFVEDFLVALEVIYRSRSSFTKGLEMESRLSSAEHANWFLVTSVEQGKFNEALEIKKMATKLQNREMYLVLNKTIGHELAGWTPAPGSAGAQLKHALIEKETKLKDQTKAHFLALYAFPEVFAANPLTHVTALARAWRTHADSN